MKFHIRGANKEEIEQTNACCLSFYHKEQDDDYPSHAVWPSVCGPSFPKVVRAMRKLSRDVEGVCNIFSEDFIKVIEKENQFHSEGTDGIAILLGLNSVVPNNSNCDKIDRDRQTIMVQKSNIIAALKDGLELYGHIVALVSDDAKHKSPIRVLFPAAITPSPKKQSPKLSVGVTYRESIHCVETALMSFALKPSNDLKMLYVCGVPGSGKSSAINKCMEEIKGRSFWKECNVDPIVANLACPTFTSGASMTAQVLQTCKCQSVEELRAVVGTGNKHRKISLFVVLDEIDFLLEESTDCSLTSTEAFLQKLLLLCSCPDNRVAVVGISNVMTGAKLDRIETIAKGKKYKTIRMAAYTLEDLVEIMKTKIAEASKHLHQDVLRYVAGRISNSSGGDARRAIATVTEIIQEWKGNNMGQELAGVSFAKKVMDAEVKMQRTFYDGLPTRVKEFLSVIVYLVKVDDNVCAGKISRVFQAEMGKRSPDEIWELAEEIPNFFCMLSDTGFVSYEETISGYPEDKHTIYLEVPAEELETYMDRTTLNFMGRMG